MSFPGPGYATQLQGVRKRRLRRGTFLTPAPPTDATAAAVAFAADKQQQRQHGSLLNASPNGLASSHSPFVLPTDPTNMTGLSHGASSSSSPPSRISPSQRHRPIATPPARRADGVSSVDDDAANGWMASQSPETAGPLSHDLNRDAPDRASRLSSDVGALGGSADDFDDRPVNDHWSTTIEPSSSYQVQLLNQIFAERETRKWIERVFVEREEAHDRHQLSSMESHEAELLYMGRESLLEEDEMWVSFHASGQYVDSMLKNAATSSQLAKQLRAESARVESETQTLQQLSQALLERDADRQELRDAMHRRIVQERSQLLAEAAELEATLDALKTQHRQRIVDINYPELKQGRQRALASSRSHHSMTSSDIVTRLANDLAEVVIKSNAALSKSAELLSSQPNAVSVGNDAAHHRSTQNGRSTSGSGDGGGDGGGGHAAPTAAAVGSLPPTLVGFL